MRQFFRRHAHLIITMIEVVIVVMLLVSVVVMLSSDPSGAGPVARMIGNTGTVVAYSLLYFTEAVLITVARVLKKYRLLKAALLFTYLTNFFAVVLQLTINGPNHNMIDNLISVLLTASAWLYYKIRLDYIHLDEMEK